jgi:hypothetical protein
VVVCGQALEFDKTGDFFWLPSLVIHDVAFLVTLVWITSEKFPYKNIGMGLLIALALITSILVSIEVTARVVNQIEVPWKLTILAYKNWSIYKGLVSAETNRYPGMGTGTTFCALLPWTMVLAVGFSRLKARTKRIATPYLQKCNFRSKCLVLGAYLLLVVFCRPTWPYGRLAKTPTLFIAQQVVQGWRELEASDSEATKGDDSSYIHPSESSYATLSGIMDDPPNVVLILLESMRADLMPFNGSAPWGSTQVLDKSLWETITPFYNNWTKSPFTAFFPLVQSVSGVTHKSLLSVLCSQHGLPVEVTVEHTKKLVNECLPSILGKYGYSSQLFKGMTRNFDHQLGLARKLGYPNMHGKEDLKLSNQDMKKYATGWMGMEDNVMLKPIMKWVDSKTSANQTSPFFLTYMTSVTHNPWGIPKNDYSPRRYSPDRQSNNILNCVSYTDKFVEKFIAEFDKRNVSDNTLFVILGDHGMDAGDYVKPTTFEVVQDVAFNVGVSFRSKNERLSRLLQSDTTKHNINGNWSTLDIAPTILEMLNIPVRSPIDKEEDREEGNLVMDGRSMLHPSGTRLGLSIVNPGEGLVLHDGQLIFVQPKPDGSKPCMVFDLDFDPLQKKRFELSSDSKVVKTHGLNQTKIDGLNKWATKANAFVKRVRKDLHEQYRTGVRCTNCTVSQLLTLESLEQWVEGNSKEGNTKEGNPKEGNPEEGNPKEEMKTKMIIRPTHPLPGNSKDSVGASSSQRLNAAGRRKSGRFISI